MCAAETERSRASSAVRSPLASPRTPSVPKRRVIDFRLALAELGCLAGLLQSGLLALDDARVAGQQPGLLQTRPVGLFVDGVQAPRDTETERAGLAGDATTVDAGDDVEASLELRGRERLVDDLLVQLVGEVAVEVATVDRPLAGAGDDAHARDGLLAATGGRGRGDGRRPGGSIGARGALGGVGHTLLVDLVGLLAGLVVCVCHVVPLRVLGRGRHWETCLISKGFAFWAACGCSGPAYTLSFFSIWRPRRFLGSMPQTAFSTALRASFSISSPMGVAERPPG